MAQEQKGGAATATAVATAPYKSVNIKPIKVDYQEPVKAPPKKHYWMGMLPGPQSLKVWKSIKDSVAWIGKCEFFQTIDVNGGGHFPAYEEPLQKNTNNEDVSIPVPGVIMHLSEEEVEAIKKGVARTFIRIDKEVVDKIEGDDNEPAKIERKKGTLITLQNPDWVDPQTGKTQPGQMSQFYRFNPRTDSPIGKYVYMVEVEANFARPTLMEFMKSPPPPMIADA